MVWLFERSDESLQLETRYDNDTSEFFLEPGIGVAKMADGMDIVFVQFFHEVASQGCKKSQPAML